LEYTDIKSFVVGESFVIYDKNTPPRALIYFGLSFINSIQINENYLIIDDDGYGTVFLHFLTPNDALQAHSLLNYVLENPNIDIDDISIDDTPPAIHWNSTAGITGSYISNYLGATSSLGFNTANDGFTFSTSISLSNWGTSSILHKDKLRDLLVNYIDDDRDGAMELMDSEFVISGTNGVVNSISTTGTYSITFDFRDLAGNILNGVNISLDIIS
jgi:hypothetical protein